MCVNAEGGVLYCNRKQQNGVGMALNEATLPLILYRKVKTIEHVIVRTSCHIFIPCSITFSASAIPTSFFVFSTLYVCNGSDGHTIFLSHSVFIHTNIHACMPV